MIIQSNGRRWTGQGKPVSHQVAPIERRAASIRRIHEKGATRSDRPPKGGAERSLGHFSWARGRSRPRRSMAGRRVRGRWRPWTCDPVSGQGSLREAMLTSMLSWANDADCWAFIAIGRGTIFIERVSHQMPSEFQVRYGHWRRRRPDRYHRDRQHELGVGFPRHRIRLGLGVGYGHRWRPMPCARRSALSVGGMPESVSVFRVEPHLEWMLEFGIEPQRVLYPHGRRYPLRTGDLRPERRRPLLLDRALRNGYRHTRWLRDV
jgi:hypothetical protein